MSWEEIPKELDDFATALEADESTERTAEDLRRMSGRFYASWRANRSISSEASVRLPIPRAHGLHPRKCRPESAHITFDFKLGELRDGFPQKADFQVVVSGALELAHGPMEVEDHWRVDTDPFADEGRHREPHPLFHFQRGGHAQDHFANNPWFVPGDSLPDSGEIWRGLMQSPSPRLPMLPMCPLLMIDFAISQHDGTIWRSLRGRGDYVRLVFDAQRRLWSPILSSLSSEAVCRRWLGPIVH